MVRGLKGGFAIKLKWTGYKKDAPMQFGRPVGEEFPISAEYGAWGSLWNRHISANGLWVRGQVNGRGQHKGVDLATPIGTPVFAMADGIITLSGWENAADPRQGFGLRVRQQIITENGRVLTLVYGHLSTNSVRAGHQVATGDTVGLSGNTGHTSGPHLHVELVDTQGQYLPIEFVQTKSQD